MMMTTMMIRVEFIMMTMIPLFSVTYLIVTFYLFSRGD